MAGAQIGGIALVGLVALLMLRQYKPEWTAFIRIAVTVVAVGMLLTLGGTVLSYVTELTEGTDVLDGETRAILLKALGVAFITETAASICRDSGEGTLAGWVEMAGKLEILLLALPLVRTVMDTVAMLLGG